MIRTKDILDEKDPRVRAKNSDVEFPLCNEYKDIIPEMLKHLRYSQIEKLSKKYDLRPGMGLAAPQMGINKNFFVVFNSAIIKTNQFFAHDISYNNP